MKARTSPPPPSPTGRGAARRAEWRLGSQTHLWLWLWLWLPAPVGEGGGGEVRGEVAHDPHRVVQSHHISHLVLSAQCCKPLKAG
jgi:hypothetical protein